MNHSRIKIKICGMTRAEDIAHAAALGVDAIGLIFYDKSPRNVSVLQAKKLLKNVSVFTSIVAVMVNPELELVYEILNEIPVQYLQFHGDEKAEFCEQFNKPYIKAIPAVSTAAIRQANKDYGQAVALLLDTPSSLYGGSGNVFDWNIIPQDLNKPLILAGGLNVGNIKEALAKCNPYAIDVNSGVELSAGIKDHEKMSQFIQAVWSQ